MKVRYQLVKMEHSNALNASFVNRHPIFKQETDAVIPWWAAIPVSSTIRHRSCGQNGPTHGSSTRVRYSDVTRLVSHEPSKHSLLDSVRIIRQDMNRTNTDQGNWPTMQNYLESSYQCGQRSVFRGYKECARRFAGWSDSHSSNSK